MKYRMRILNIFPPPLGIIKTRYLATDDVVRKRRLQQGLRKGYAPEIFFCIIYPLSIPISETFAYKIQGKDLCKTTLV
jgi:hypothetical protein